MQDGDPEMLKALERKLGALVRCVLKQAQSDPPFAGQLQEILLSDTLRANLKERKAGSERPTFNPVAYLQAHGRDGLHRELEGKPTSELSGVVRSHRIVKGKPAKSLERPALIEAILSYSERSLNQGGAFLRDRRADDANPPESPAKAAAGRPGEGEVHDAGPNAGRPSSQIEAAPADAGAEDYTTHR